MDLCFSREESVSPSSNLLPPVEVSIWKHFSIVWKVDFRSVYVDNLLRILSGCVSQASFKHIYAPSRETFAQRRYMVDIFCLAFHLRLFFHLLFYTQELIYFESKKLASQMEKFQNFLDRPLFLYSSPACAWCLLRGYCKLMAIGKNIGQTCFRSPAHISQNPIKINLGGVVSCTFYVYSKLLDSVSCFWCFNVFLIVFFVCQDSLSSSE